MKTNFSFGKKLHATILASLLLGAVAPLSHAAPAPPRSPVGTTWDCLSSGGGQPGIAFLNFSNDYTFTGDMIVAGTPAAASTNPRTSGSTGRGDTTSSPNVVTTNLFGYWAVEGPWGYDIKGRLVGSFVQQIKVAPIVTVNWNTITVTTPDYTTTNSDYKTDLITVTNPVSFFVESTNGAQGYRDTNYFVRTFDGPFSTRTYNWIAVNKNDGSTNTYSANLTFFNELTNIGPVTTNFTFTFAAATFTNNIAWIVTGPNGYVNNYTNLFVTNDILGYSLSGVVTNRVSFVGTVTPNKRLTLVASTSLGGNHLTFTGVPMNINKLPDISGHWTGTKLENNVNYIEFSDVTPSLRDSVILPYLFYADGKGILAGGAGYDVNGWVMISSQKQIAFSEYEQQWGSTNRMLRAFTGPLSVSKKAITAKTKGLDETDSSLKFNATLALP